VSAKEGVMEEEMEGGRKRGKRGEESEQEGGR
jgi:hypothetical protein